MKSLRSVWLFSRGTDITLLFIPVWIIWIVCFWLPETVLQSRLPIWMWAVFILGIDVSHVWSTIYRTYCDREERTRHWQLFLIAPAAAFALFLPIALISLIAFESSLLFWRILAYFALYHFIKQQYGFLALYKTRAGDFGKRILSDKHVIYLSMLWPVAYWHMSGDRSFGWMIDHDFFDMTWTWTWSGHPWSSIALIGHTAYWLIISAWVVEDIIISRQQHRQISVGKILWLITTALNWWLGIVWFNSDVAFSLTNVVAHGIPYIVLVFFYVERKQAITTHKIKNIVGSALSIILMAIGILVLGFVEEYHWDMLINRQRQALFETIWSYPVSALSSPISQAIALAVLSTPQVAHYIIDGYIWRGGSGNPYIKKVFVPPPPQD